MVLVMLLLSANAVVGGESAEVPLGVLAVVVANVFLVYTKKWIEVRPSGWKPQHCLPPFRRDGGSTSLDLSKSVLRSAFRFKLAWHRTDKFNMSGSLVRAFRSSRTETLIA